MKKYIIKEGESGFFLTENVNDNPDDACWGEAYDDEPLFFKTEIEAKDLVEKFLKIEDNFWYEEYEEPEKVEILLTKSEKEILVSTLTCTLARSYEFGSFGNQNTKFDSSVIGHIVAQLAK